LATEEPYAFSDVGKDADGEIIVDTPMQFTGASFLCVTFEKPHNSRLVVDYGAGCRSEGLRG
jgi:hypothetical protein